MTRLTRPVTRLVIGQRGEPFAVRMTEAGLMIRKPRARLWYGPIDYGWLYVRGGKMEADLKRATKARKGRRRSDW